MDADEREDDGSYSRAERDELQTKLEAAADARDVFIMACVDAASRYRLAVTAADKRLVSKFSAGFIEEVQGVISDAASDFLDAQEVDRFRQIVESGRD